MSLWWSWDRTDWFGVEKGQSRAVSGHSPPEAPRPDQNMQIWFLKIEYFPALALLCCIAFLHYRFCRSLPILQIQPDPPPHRKGLFCFRCELGSSHHMMPWLLKHFKWVTDGSPDKRTGEGSPSLRPSSELPPEAAAQTHTMVRGRTQLWQPQLQKQFWAVLALGLAAASSFRGSLLKVIVIFKETLFPSAARAAGTLCTTCTVISFCTYAENYVPIFEMGWVDFPVLLMVFLIKKEFWFSHEFHYTTRKSITTY